MKEYNFYVYILTNWNNKVMYVGVTNNLERRMYEYKNKLVDGFTKKYNVNKLVYYEQGTDVHASIAREKEIKKWRREKKKKIAPYARRNDGTTMDNNVIIMWYNRTPVRSPKRRGLTAVQSAPSIGGFRPAKEEQPMKSRQSILSKVVATSCLIIALALVISTINAQDSLDISSQAQKVVSPTSLLADRSVVVEPDQLVFLQLQSPLEFERVLTPQEGVTVRSLRWRAVGGSVLHADPFWVVYQAPSVEGIGYLIYEGAEPHSTEWGVMFTVSDSADPESETTLPNIDSRGFNGAFIPLMGTAPTLVHMSLSRNHSGGQRPFFPAPDTFLDREGNVRIKFPRKPMVPPADGRSPFPGRPCNRPPSTAPSMTVQEALRANELAGTIEVTEQLSAQLGGVGVQVEVGRKVNVYQQKLSRYRYTIEDCYACVNGRYQYKGSRVNAVECHYVIGYEPSWVGDAILRGWIGGFQPPSRSGKMNTWCQSSGDACPCPNPKTPVLIRGCEDL